MVRQMRLVLGWTPPLDTAAACAALQSAVGGDTLDIEQIQ